ncbi:endonuclease domain-containing protein [Microvirga sp. P5_D2]
MKQFIQRARQLRESQTNAEALLWRALRNRRLARWKFRRQHPVGRFVVDLVCLDAKLVIEVDGATHSTADEIARDTMRTHELETCGYHVLRLQNADVYENIEGVLETILAELELRTHL